MFVLWRFSVPQRAAQAVRNGPFCRHNLMTALAVCVRFCFVGFFEIVFFVLFLANLQTAVLVFVYFLKFSNCFLLVFFAVDSYFDFWGDIFMKVDARVQM